MTRTEAAEIVELIAKSLNDNPGQFNLSVNLTGQQITSYGGTGLQVTAMGGGPGSNTIGQQVSVSGADLRIEQSKAEFREEVVSVVSTMMQLAEKLREETPDSSQIQESLQSLKKTWIPGVIIGVIGNVVTKALGL